jgi:hypothetical protein
MARRTRRRSRAGVAVLLVLVAAGVAAVIQGPNLLHKYGDRWFATSRCTVTIDGVSSSLTATQADNAALIAATALRRGLPAHAVTVALATAIQESDLRNLDYGDRDSVGLFQQRPSQGWGTVDQIRDPHYATNQFYDHLVLVTGWEAMPVTDAAQAVQRSALPLGYADHEANARLWARALTGEVPFGSITCSLPSAKTDPEAAQTFAARVSADFGEQVAVSIAPQSDGSAAVHISSGEQSVMDAAASWSTAVASGWPVADVTLCDRGWVRARDTWRLSEPTALGCAKDVVVTFVTR